MPRFSRWTVVCVLIAAGCVQAKPVVRPTAPVLAASATNQVAQPAVIPLGGTRGKIISVNGRLRFVVVRFGLNPLPEIGSRYEIVREGQAVGMLKMSGPFSGTTIVADILEGDPQVGDETRMGPIVRSAN